MIESLIFSSYSTGSFLVVCQLDRQKRFGESNFGSKRIRFPMAIESFAELSQKATSFETFESVRMVRHYSR